MFTSRLFVAITAALILYLVAATIIRYFNTAPRAEPDPTEVEPVNYRYYCTICGTEVTMTAAPASEIPDPPRHCREDMTLVVQAPDF